MRLCALLASSDCLQAAIAWSVGASARPMMMDAAIMMAA